MEKAMNSKRAYTGIDYFRLIAAFMVMTIHTSPLLTYSETADFILTRIIARIAVPFFFMTSGFFLISRYSKNSGRLKTFIKKTALIYAAAILIYLPINIYNDYFSESNLLPNIIKDIFIDGTMYHLWYLPASIIGGLIAWLLVKKFDYNKALIAALALYAIGLFGDSYFGIAEKLPFVNGFYTLVFQVCDYTRNGFFFATVFFVLGGAFHDSCIDISPRKSVLGFVVSFAMMFSEAIVLRTFNLPRHDSMYLFLLPCTLFLFAALLSWRGKRRAWLRDMSLIIYIIHPMAIVFVRAAAKLLKLQDLLIYNSVVHFLSVSVISTAFAFVLSFAIYKFGKNRKHAPISTERAWIELNTDNLRNNVDALNQTMPQKCELMAVVKAEAYGHGAFETAVYLEKIGVKAFAVATIDEGIELRSYGIREDILILGYTSPERVRELKRFKLIQTLVSYEHAVELNSKEVKTDVHIKLDTGMHRLGFDCEDVSKIAEVFNMKNIAVKGIYTHLCAADSLSESDVIFTENQIRSFYNALDKLKAAGIKIPKTHIQSSYGLLNYPSIECDYVRAGVSLYGVLSKPDDETRLKLDLKPLLSLKSRVVMVRDIKTGDTVGYGRAFAAERDVRIAIISIGYADGLPRNLSCGDASVIINGCKARIVGRICMDQTSVDVTDIENVKEGTEVTVIGEGISAETVAEESGSITNELLSRLGRRLKIFTIGK